MRGGEVYCQTAVQEEHAKREMARNLCRSVRPPDGDIVLTETAVRRSMSACASAEARSVRVAEDAIARYSAQVAAWERICLQRRFADISSRGM
jgi:hypothetical protein